ncbi:MAG: putative flavoprotein involved in K+ transport [Phormidium sp. OSCR]|nr:MAG: putative flavoprotein involved in K+ transport [Phormidium sp. OSCR]
MGSLIAAFGPRFARCLQLQDEVNVPLGLVFKEMGQQLPETHLSDPHRVFRQLKLLDLAWGLLRWKAHKLDKEHPNFQNQPL